VGKILAEILLFIRREKIMELEQLHEEMFNLNEDNAPAEDVMLYMNTWKNYHENGADAEQIGGGWKSLDDALAFWEKQNELGEEPFINDFDDNVDLPFEIGENAYLPDLVEKIKDFIDLDDSDKTALRAIMEADSYDYDDAKDILDSGDFVFYEDVKDNYTLAENEIWNTGSFEDAVGSDKLSYYVDEDSLRDSWYYDVRDYYVETMQDDDPDFSEDDIMEDEFDNYFDAYIQDYIDMACQEPQAYKSFWEEFFDYESYGKDLAYDFTFTEQGAIYIYH
jgi:hypothetical protein